MVWHKVGGNYVRPKKKARLVSQNQGRISHKSKTTEWACFCEVKERSQVIEGQLMGDFEIYY